MCTTEIANGAWRKSGMGSLIFFAVLQMAVAAIASSAEEGILEEVRIGVGKSGEKIKTVAFNYSVDYNVSEQWRAQEREFLKARMSEGQIDEAQLRIPTLEHTVRKGKAMFEGNKFNISSKKTAIADDRVFEDYISVYDGAKLKEFDRNTNTGCISNDISRRRGDLMFDPRNFPLLFVDGSPLYSALTEAKATVEVLGTEDVEGDTCYVVDILRSFETIERGTDGKVTKRVHRKCWLAKDKDYLVKKAISYRIDSPERPLSITQCDLSEISENIWYYTDITFESHPVSSTKADIIAVLHLEDIVVNAAPKDGVFDIMFPGGCFVADEINGTRYQVGPSL